jgi:hypothetical protein
LIVVAKSPNQDPNKKEHANETCPAIAQLGTWLPHSIYLPWRKIGPIWNSLELLRELLLLFRETKNTLRNCHGFGFAELPNQPILLPSCSELGLESRLIEQKMRCRIRDPSVESWAGMGTGAQRYVCVARTSGLVQRGFGRSGTAGPKEGSHR